VEGRLRRRRAHRTAARAQAATQARTDVVATLIEQVLQVAKARTIKLPVEPRRKLHHVVVRFNDDTATAYFRDLQAYQRAANARQVLPWEAEWRVPRPAPVNKWGQDRLEQWLKDNQ